VTTPALLLHDPHSSTVIPAGVRDQFVLSDAELERELLLMTDRHVDELLTLPAAGAVTVRQGVSRLVCDPERFEGDEDGVTYGRAAPAPRPGLCV
jgi:N-formylglutamate deformylase